MKPDQLPYRPTGLHTCARSSIPAPRRPQGKFAPRARRLRHFRDAPVRLRCLADFRRTGQSPKTHQDRRGESSARTPRDDRRHAFDLRPARHSGTGDCGPRSHRPGFGGCAPAPDRASGCRLRRVRSIRPPADRRIVSTNRRARPTCRRAAAAHANSPARTPPAEHSRGRACSLAATGPRQVSVQYGS